MSLVVLALASVSAATIRRQLASQETDASFLVNAMSATRAVLIGRAAHCASPFGKVPPTETALVTIVLGLAGSAYKFSASSNRVAPSTTSGQSQRDAQCKQQYG